MEMGKMPKWKAFQLDWKLDPVLPVGSGDHTHVWGAHAFQLPRLHANVCVVHVSGRSLLKQTLRTEILFLGGIKRRRDGCVKRKSVQSGWQTSALSYHPIFYPFIHYLPRPQRHNKLSCSNTYQVQHYVSNMLLATWLLLCKCSWLVFQTKPFPSALDNVCVQRLFLDCGWKYRC